MRQLISPLLATTVLCGCVTSDIRPQPKVQAVQAVQQIDSEELLDVGIRIFDPGVPADISDTEALAKKRIFPDLRRAEARWMPVKLRSTLESTSQWGAVRVIPDGAEFQDVIVTGKILESTGRKLALEISARDAQGRVWLDKFRAEAIADLGSYKTDAAIKARDPFENVYATIANALLAVRERLSPAERREIRRVADMRFAADIAPQAASGYLTKDAAGLVRLSRLPAENDRLMARVASMRERDHGVIDTIDGYHGNFYENLSLSYGQFRRMSFDEIEKEERARASARTRMALGAATVLASVLAPSPCSGNSYACENLESVARTAGAAGGVAAIISGYKKFADARQHAEALAELADSFSGEARTQVVEVEGRTLRLTGTAEEQYREWRRLLAELYRVETGAELPSPAAPDQPKQ
ncbi:MAG: hypothetical protein RML32_12465 [Gammaproteobacteria bacterium]|nr:hypothetical protein [Gammaproteobacteria bacterium]